MKKKKHRERKYLREWRERGYGVWFVAGLGGMAGDELRWWCGGDGGGPISLGVLIDFLYKIHYMHSMI